MNKGFISLPFIVLLVVLVGGAVVWWAMTQKPSASTTSTLNESVSQSQNAHPDNFSTEIKSVINKDSNGTVVKTNNGFSFTISPLWRAQEELRDGFWRVWIERIGVGSTFADVGCNYDASAVADSLTRNTSTIVNSLTRNFEKGGEKYTISYAEMESPMEVSGRITTTLVIYGLVMPSEWQPEDWNDVNKIKKVCSFSSTLFVNKESQRVPETKELVNKIYSSWK